VRVYSRLYSNTSTLRAPWIHSISGDESFPPQRCRVTCERSSQSADIREMCLRRAARPFSPWCGTNSPSGSHRHAQNTHWPAGGDSVVQLGKDRVKNSMRWRWYLIMTSRRDRRPGLLAVRFAALLTSPWWKFMWGGGRKCTTTWEVYDADAKYGVVFFLNWGRNVLLPRPVLRESGGCVS